jgi:hypothetical protein
MSMLECLKFSMKSLISLRVGFSEFSRIWSFLVCFLVSFLKVSILSLILARMVVNLLLKLACSRLRLLCCLTRGLFLGREGSSLEMVSGFFCSPA